jgi:two-component sensor histidine kinase
MHTLLLALDVKTLIAVLVIGFSVAVILLLLDILPGGSRFDRIFILGLLLQAIGWALIDLRSLVPDFLSFSVGNSLQFCGMALEGLGLLSLKRHPDRPWIASYEVSLALMLAAWWFPGIANTTRIFLISLPYPIFFGVPGYFLLDLNGKKSTKLQRFIGIVLIIYPLGMLVRGFFVLNQDSYSLASQGLLQVLVLLLQVLVMILGSTGYILVRKEEANESLARASEEKNLLLLELQHRVKNSLSIIASLASLEGELHDEEFRESMGKVRDRINAVAKLYELLINTDPTKGVRLDSYMRDIAQKLVGSYTASPGRVGLALSLDPVTLDAKSAIAVGLIVNELATNALKHAFPGDRAGTLSLGLAAKDGRIELVVADDGVGMPESWTEGSSKGLGTLLVSTLVKQISGTLAREAVRGASVRISFPCPEPLPSAGARLMARATH